MDPVTFAAVAGVGLAAQGAGSYLGYGASKGQAQAQQESAAANAKIAGLQQGIEAQKFRAMELDASRRSLESIRAGQRARASGLAAATSQGAGSGSGLQGGYGNISGQMGTSLVGIGQNLEIGRNIFGLNAQISEQKIAIANAGAKSAQYGSEAALGQGLTSFGGSLMSAAGSAGKLAGNFGGGYSASPSYGEDNKY